jgi:hypothetical protein
VLAQPQSASQAAALCALPPLRAWRPTGLRRPCWRLGARHRAEHHDHSCGRVRQGTAEPAERSRAAAPPPVASAPAWRPPSPPPPPRPPKRTGDVVGRCGRETVLRQALVHQLQRDLLRRQALLEQRARKADSLWAGGAGGGRAGQGTVSAARRPRRQLTSTSVARARAAAHRRTRSLESTSHSPSHAMSMNSAAGAAAAPPVLTPLVPAPERSGAASLLLVLGPTRYLGARGRQGAFVREGAAAGDGPSLKQSCPPAQHRRGRPQAPGPAPAARPRPSLRGVRDGRHRLVLRRHVQVFVLGVSKRPRHRERRGGPHHAVARHAKPSLAAHGGGTRGGGRAAVEEGCRAQGEGALGVRQGQQLGPLVRRLCARPVCAWVAASPRGPPPPALPAPTHLLDALLLLADRRLVVAREAHCASRGLAHDAARVSHVGHKQLAAAHNGDARGAAGVGAEVAPVLAHEAIGLGARGAAGVGVGAAGALGDAPWRQGGGGGRCARSRRGAEGGRLRGDHLSSAAACPASNSAASRVSRRGPNRTASRTDRRAGRPARGGARGRASSPPAAGTPRSGWPPGCLLRTRARPRARPRRGVSRRWRPRCRRGRRKRRTARCRRGRRC